jgi:hypothetical protein
VVDWVEKDRLADTDLIGLILFAFIRVIRGKIIPSHLCAASRSSR